MRRAVFQRVSRQDILFSVLRDDREGNEKNEKRGNRRPSGFPVVIDWVLRLTESVLKRKRDGRRSRRGTRPRATLANPVKTCRRRNEISKRYPRYRESWHGLAEYVRLVIGCSSFAVAGFPDLCYSFVMAGRQSLLKLKPAVAMVTFLQGQDPGGVPGLFFGNYIHS